MRITMIVRMIAVRIIFFLDYFLLISLNGIIIEAFIKIGKVAATNFQKLNEIYIQKPISKF